MINYRVQLIIAQLINTCDKLLPFIVIMVVRVNSVLRNISNIDSPTQSVSD